MIRFEFSEPRSPYWPAIRYHAMRHKRYRKENGIHIIEYGTGMGREAYMLYQKIRYWECVKIHVINAEAPQGPEAFLIAQE